MKRLWALVSILGCSLFGVVASAQGLTLEECLERAEACYPLAKKWGLIAKTAGYDLQNIGRDWLPRVGVGAQASLQSDVAELPSALQQMLSTYGYDYKGLAKDQYRIALEVEQTLYDGGSIRARRDEARLEQSEQEAQLGVGLYAVRGRVIELFFGILLCDERLRLNESLITLLEDNCAKTNAKLRGGVASVADSAALRAELLGAEQQRVAILATRQSCLRMLSLFIGLDEKDMGAIVKPEVVACEDGVNRRPELALYEAQSRLLEAKEGVLRASLRPRLSLFMTGYWGYPGYDMFGDMFSHDWSLNGQVGVRLSWNFSSLYTHKNDVLRLRTARESVEVDREVFLFNSELETIEDEGSIASYRRQMEKDDEIIDLRRTARRAAESRLEHGTGSTNDLLQEITREQEALCGRAQREIEMLRAMYLLRNNLNQ